jgi:hypothetical protein
MADQEPCCVPGCQSPAKWHVDSNTLDADFYVCSHHLAMMLDDGKPRHDVERVDLQPAKAQP